MAHRRRIGVGARKTPPPSRSTTSPPPPSALSALSTSLQNDDIAFVESSVTKLKKELTAFAETHAESIRTDPAFRTKVRRQPSQLYAM